MSYSLTPSNVPDIAPSVPRTNAALVRYYLGKEWKAVATASILAPILGGISSTMTVMMGPAVNILGSNAHAVMDLTAQLGSVIGPLAAKIVGQNTLERDELLHRLPALLLICAALRALLGVSQWYLWERSGERVSMALRHDLVANFLRLDPAVRKTAAASVQEAALSSTVTSDVRMLREYLVHYYGGMPREAFQVLWSTVTLYFLSPKLFLVFLFGVAPVAAVASRIGKKLRRRAGRALEDYSALTEWLQQRLLGIETIKHYGTEAVESKKMRELTASLMERFLRAARVKARTSPTLETLAIVAMAIVLFIAVSDVAAGTVTATAIISFFVTVGVMSQSAGKLGRYLNSNREGAAAVDRLVTRLGFFADHRRDQPAARAALERQDGNVASFRFTDVSVRYDGAAEDALTDFSFNFMGGRIYCLVGPSGAGKSTVFATALGLVEPRAGRVEVSDGKQNIVYMPQKVQLAPMSLLANVAYPDANGDAERAKEALAKVGLHALAAGFPEGLEALVGEGGAGVSGGQAQRILLARLWYHRASFIFVDEGTSALDPEVERLVYSLLDELAKGGAAVVTIAHRPSAARIADEILLLDRGRLVGHGNPADVERLPLFQRLMR